MLTIDEINKNAKECHLCSLRDGAKQVVPGDGNPKARLMLIGEGPGKEEDEQGRPFVGAAGQLLDNILKASKITREEVYIANVVKCRPPRNRNPQQEEINTCKPWLDLQIAAVSPDLIVCLGLTASRAVLGVNDSLHNLRGKWHNFGEIKVLCTYHPAALLRSPRLKIPTWEDFQMVMKEYGTA
ncbi:MAG TPA: uracil-DNA glycosylase [Firmicutes bacterium]|jgi:uracil-DNA glycosylase family 4|nr:uracil-DNA glycosylase [Bacillota bacterium]